MANKDDEIPVAGVPFDVSEFFMNHAGELWVLRSVLRSSWRITERIFGYALPRRTTQLDTYWRLMADDVRRAAQALGEEKLIEMENTYRREVHMARRKRGRKPKDGVSNITVVPEVVMAPGLHPANAKIVPPAPSASPAPPAAPEPKIVPPQSQPQPKIVRPDDSLPATPAVDSYWGDDSDRLNKTYD